MKKIFLTYLAFCGLVFHAQNVRESNFIDHPLKQIFKVDTTGSFGGTIINANNYDAARFRNDTLLVNVGTSILSKYYNFRVSEDSLDRLSDTILFRDYPLYVTDSLTNTLYDTIPQKYGFFWSRAIPVPNNLFIDPDLNCYGNRVIGCIWTRTHFTAGNNVCRYVLTCNVNQFTNWCSGKVYTKVFEDNFDGDELDHAYWRIGLPWGARSVPPDGLGWTANKNAQVSNGTLKLLVTNTPGPFTDNDNPDPAYASVKPNNFNFVDGVISTNFKTGYGKYEIRAKIPPILGVSPCYWLFGQNVEIDGFEFFKVGRGNRPSMSIYSSIPNGCDRAYSNGATDIYRIAQFTGGNTDGDVWQNLPNLSDGTWRNYTIVYDPGFITWFIEDFNTNERWILTFHRKVQQGAATANPYDNCTCNSCTTQENVNFPDCSNNDVQLILSNSAKCNSGGNFLGWFGWFGPNQCGPLTNVISTFEIDYVRIYQTDDCGQNKTLTQGTFNNTNNTKSNSVTGDVITIGGAGGGAGAGGGTPYIVQSGANPLPNVLPQTNPLFVRANDEVQLLNGFSAEEGSLFEATNAFRGFGIYPSDCGTLNYYPQYLRPVNPANTADTAKNTVSTKLLRSLDGGVELIVYPNPANKHLQFQTNQLITKVETINLNGQIIASLDQPGDAINIESLSPGLYFIKFYFENSIIMSKFIRE